VTTVPKRYRQTGGRTDKGRQTNLITALCVASRGKNYNQTSAIKRINN